MNRETHLSARERVFGRDYVTISYWAYNDLKGNRECDLTELTVTSGGSDTFMSLEIVQRA
jgi:hypothetical protein